MVIPSSLQPWKSQLGAQRDWFWRGWRIRYTFIRTAQADAFDATPIVLIHGFGSALTQWHANLAPLSDRHPIYALDLLGFGSSEKAATAYSTSLWAEQIHDFWTAIIRRPIILVGHSLGALVAATATATYPDMVRGVAIMTLPATRQEVLPARWIQPLVSTVERIVASPLLIRLIFQVARRPAFLRLALRSAYANSDRITDDVITSFFLPTCDRGAAQTLCRLSQSATQLDYSPSRPALLRQIHRPILILWGEKDCIIPIAQAKQLIELNSAIIFRQIANAGHCLYDECAEEINHVLLTWIANLA
jgi:pimeloyl-ACP methyl ester carboxylesterase